MDLRKRAINGLFWHTGTTYTWKAIEFLVVLFLARVFSPEDFGIMALIFFLVSVIRLFSMFGLQNYIIQTKKDLNAATDTVFILAVIIGIFVYVLTFITAPGIAAFYGEERLTSLLRIIALSSIVSSFSIPASAILEKKLEFKKEALPILLGWVTYGIVAALYAHKIGVWAFVYGYLTLNIVGTLCFLFITGYRPSLKFRKDIAIDALSYGKDITLYNILSFFTMYGIDGVVAKLYGTAILGYFSIANKFALLLSKNVTALTGRVAFSAFSEISENKKVIKEHFSKMIEYSLFLLFPATLGIFSLAEYIIPVLYGSSWSSSVPLLKIIVIGGLFLSLTDMYIPLLFASRRQKDVVHASLIQISFFLVFIYPVSKISINAVALLFSLSLILRSTILFNSAQNLVKLNLKKLFIQYTYIFISGTIMLILLVPIKKQIKVALPGLFILIILGLITYLATAFFLNKSIFKRMILIFRETLFK